MRELRQPSRADVSLVTQLARVTGLVIGAAVAVEAINTGLALLNAPSDLAVTAGVLLLAVTVTAGVVIVRRFWR